MAFPIDFWFSIGSLYTYLAVMRLPEVEARTGAAFRWRPFSVRTIMIEMDNIPAKKPAKLAYSWRDVERRAEAYGYPFPSRPPYPLQNSDLANRIATVGAAEGWCPDYVRAAYRRWFLDHEEAGSERSNVGLSARDRTGCAPGARACRIRGDHQGVRGRHRRSAQPRHFRRADIRQPRRDLLGRRPAGRCRPLAPSPGLNRSAIAP